MGTISKYKQKQLASSAVGTPGVSQAAGAVAASLSNVGDMLIQRQQTLDKAQYTNAYYDYVQRDELKRLELQRNLSNEPEKFREQYRLESNALAGEVKQNLPERMRPQFDLLVNKRHASMITKNITWTFNQQNKLGLDRVAEASSSYALTASTAVDSNQFLEQAAEFDLEFDNTYAPLVDPASGQQARDVSHKNALIMYTSSMMDNKNGGAFQLATDLKQNEGFRKFALETLGAKGFQTLSDRAEKQVMSLISEQAFDALQTADLGTRAAAQQLFEKPASVALAETEQAVIATRNALERLKLDKNASLYGEQIAILQEQLKQSELLSDIARNRDNHTVVTNEGVKTDLINKIFDATIGIRTTKERTELGENVSRDQLRAIDKGSRRFRPLFGGVLGYLFKDDLKESVADQNYSGYLKNLYEVKGEILAERAKGNLTDKDANFLITKFAGQLSTLSQYDRVRGGNNDFVQAYNAFDSYSKSVTIPGLSGQQSRKLRDVFRNRLLDSFVEKRAIMMDAISQTGEEIPAEQIPTRSLVDATIREFAAAFVPAEYGALKPGKDYVMQNGVPVQFMGIDRTSGRMVLKTPKELTKNLNNV